MRNVLGAGANMVPGRVQTAVIESFTPDQILTFLTKFYDGDVARGQTRWETLAAVRDLLGLSRNPRMLSFIAALPDERLDQVAQQHGVLSAADLYAELVGHWLGYETGRLRHQHGVPVLDDDERLTAVMTLARRLWVTGLPSIGLEDLTTQVAECLSGLPDKGFTLHQAAHAVGSGTLLVRREDATFEFVHRSIMEWLVARAAAEQLNDAGTASLLDVRAASPLMADFLADLAGHAITRQWATQVLAVRGATTAAKDTALALTRRLPTTTLHLSGQDLRGGQLADRCLAQANLSEVNLSGETLTGIDLTAADLRGADLRGINLRDVCLVGADLREADLRQARLTEVDLTNANLAGSRWQRAALLGSTIDPSMLDSPELADAAISGRDPIQIVHNSGDSARRLVMAPDGTLLIAARGIVLQVVDVITGRSQGLLTGHTSWITAVAVAECEGRSVVVTGSEDATVRVWDLATGAPLGKSWVGHTGGVLSVAVAECEGRSVVVTGSEDATMRVWDLVAGDEINQFVTGHCDGVESVAVTTLDSRPVAITSGVEDAEIRVWDLVSRTLARQPWAGHAGQVMSVVVAECEGRSVVVTGGGDATVRVWDLATGTPVGRPWTGHTSGVMAVAVAELAGRPVVVTGGGDAMVRVWDLATGAPVGRPWSGHTGQIRSITVTDMDGRPIVITGGGDATIRVWDLATGTLLATMVNLADGRWARLFPNGSYRLEGDPADAFWWGTKLCRFSSDELGAYVPAIQRLACDEPQERNNIADILDQVDGSASDG